jgi:hypothetical protein
MKKIKWIFLVGLFFLATFIAFGQEPTEPPADWGDIIMNPAKWFAGFGAISFLTAFLATFVIGILKITKNFSKQLIAWLVAVVLLIGSNLMNFGYAASFPILLTVIHGLGAGLAANGVFDIPLLKGLLDGIEKLLNEDS